MDEFAERARDIEKALALAGLAFWRWVPEAKEFIWSPELNRMLGREPNPSQTAESLLAYVHPEDRDETLQVLLGVVAEQGELTHEFRAIRTDGTLIHLRSTARVVVAGEGVSQVRGISQDITERVQAEAALRESEENHRYTVELSPQMPWTADAEGKILSVCSRWVQLTGVPEQQLRLSGWWSLVHPEDEELVRATWLACLKTGQPGAVEFRIRAADGSYRWLRATAAPRLAGDGKVLRWHGAAEDIHERKLAEAALRESEEHYRYAVELNPQIPWTADPSGNILEVGPRWPELMGLSTEQALGQGWVVALHPDDVAPTLALWRTHLASGEPLDHEYRMRLRDGTYNWMRVRAAARRDQTGRVLKWYGTVEDVQAQKVAQLGLKASEARLAAILESTTDNVIVVDKHWRVTYLNRRAAEFVGPGRRVEVGVPLGEVFPEGIGTELHTRLLQAAGRSEATEFEAFLEPLQSWIEVHAYPTEDGLSIFFRDATEERQARDRLEYLARHDPLTGLANRDKFNEKLASAFAAGDGAAVAVLHLDLDEFKTINDSLGHPVGDELLCQAAARFQTVVAGAGLLARLGGDEFALICHVPDGSDVPLELAHRLQECLKQPLKIDGHLIRMGVSIGIAVGRSGDETADELFKNADIALYRAKAEGRGSYRLFEPGMHEQVRTRQAMKDDLAEALDRDQLELHFQPLMNVDRSEVVGLEALLRWRHPERGLVPPNDFIPLAEETGMITSLGDWVLDRACRAAKSWPADISVSVNLSPLQFKDEVLPLRIAKVLYDTGLRPDRLQLEITETVLLQDSEQNAELLRAIANLGVGIALDDFGTGFSSLSYLRSFAFDNLKIDRSFVNEIGASKNSEEIVRAVIALAHTLGLSVTAEGVETAAQLSWLREIGCHQAQGYLISRPVPEHEVLPLLKARRTFAA